MLAAAIITFREMLEICLIISIISAALNTVKNKKIILMSGIIIGAVLSIIIAFSFSYINKVFQDIGQELLNILILSISIICIAYTSMLMNKNTKNLHKKIDLTKQQLENKEISHLALILVISLIMSREGAELVIFLHGIYASGQEIQNVILGMISGSLIGVVISFLFYSGLLKIPFRYFFKIINILLILLIAGMASQLANLLHSSDLVPILYEQVWDSSWLISDNNITGNILYNLVGYSSRPTQLQLLFYIATVVIMTSLIYRSKKAVNS